MPTSGNPNIHNGFDPSSLTLSLALRLVSAVPPGTLPAVARVAGRIHYHLARPKRRAYLKNLSQSVDFKSNERPWHAFQNHTLNLLELLRAASNAGPAARDLPALAGLDHVDRALERGRGMILATMHSGNWELAGLALAAAGYPLTTVAGVQLRAGWSDAVKAFKQRSGIRIVSAGTNMRALLRDLSENRIAALHLDGDVYAGGVEVNLLGRKARVPRGPARLSRIMASPVAFAYCYRDDRGNLEVVIEPAHEPPADAAGETVLTAKLVARMEKRIVEAPGQWCIFREM